MTVAFSHKLLPPADCTDIFGCVQQSEEPSGDIIEIKKPKRCRNCKCLMFPLEDGKREDCPLCHPQATFANKTFKFDVKSRERNLIVFVFDITVPLSALNVLLYDLYNNTTDKDTISLILVSDRIVFITIVNGLVVFETYTHSSEITTTISHSFDRETLKNVVIPSISSAFALIPAKLLNVYDYYDIFKCACKISNETPFKLFLFSNRHCDTINADDAKYISEMVKENDSIIHIGCINEFKRFTAATRSVFGKVFSVTTLPKSGYLSKLGDKHVNKFRIFAPGAFEFTKVTNSSGNLRMSPNLSKLKLNGFTGGSVRFSFDAGRTDFKILRLLEEVRTTSGTFLTLHTFNVAESVEKFRESIQNEVYNTLILKGFASDVLRSVWNGDKFDQILPNLLLPVKDLLKGTSLHNIGANEQIDILRLYYVLCSYGNTDIKARIVKMENSEALIVPPSVFILDEDGKSDKYEEILSKFDWPFELKFIQNKSAFQFVAEKFGLNIADI
ncbi:hypothetical protein TVAG_106850 [Trichomonas vaginalis G3]|uniref:Sec23/Sec24 trunk domain containing protein n=1 Tax=Trichomonas vaginalis (strain ATCC PRA-98 / G3) TaxID=412133 RepID=A2E6H7_TRIV3|nr:hypothetical protein TVAGG3_0040370 [Trichomonas vaginalis G3]EAY11790.1 hypothetical protein TVAG_106850 [Trichomonas vaginalis G3]KAI5540659.1 hypothetical protein TVAGG3_0040370 [Trichomonas vaginalis G3]|eukprot:XP_001324013.1 hypothetical protein [Trichomonas vaginalis G3]